MALPRSFFSARTQRGLLALAGPLAVVRIDDRSTFIRQFVALRFWLLQVPMFAAGLHVVFTWE